MNLDTALSIAASGLANVNSQLALVSHNVANASTPGYVTETATQQSMDDGVGLGVRTGPATRCVDTVLQQQLFQQNAGVSGLQTQQSALQAIDAVQGTPGQGNDLASLLQNLQNQFSALLNNPADQAQQAAVVSNAAKLANGINTMSNQYTDQRQSAETDLSSAVDTLNKTLGTIGGLNNQIMTLRERGQSTADLENQRDSAIQTLSQLVDVKVLQQPNGGVLITTAGGTVLPTDAGTAPFSTSGANLQPGAYYPGGGVSGISLGGVDVTGRLTGGRIGADITLRDTTLPTFQAELDEFAQNLASRFNVQGLALFTDPTGAVPSVSPSPPVQSNYVGFAGTIQVNPSVTATPSLVRDGTAAPPTGQAGYTAIIQNVLTYAFGSDQSSGVPQPASNTSGLGPTGTLNAPYTAPTTLGGIASTLVASQSQTSADVTNQLGTEQAVQTTLSNQLNSSTGVNMDTEMSTMIQLQNSYGANARVMNAVQAMWTQLLSAVQ